MLVLQRKIGESCIIGEGLDQVVVTVLGIQGCRVKLGVDADQSVPVYRQEVWERIHGTSPAPAFLRQPLECAGW